MFVHRRLRNYTRPCPCTWQRTLRCCLECLTTSDLAFGGVSGASQKKQQQMLCLRSSLPVLRFRRCLEGMTAKLLKTARLSTRVGSLPSASEKHRKNSCFCFFVVYKCVIQCSVVCENGSNERELRSEDQVIHKIIIFVSGVRRATS